MEALALQHQSFSTYEPEIFPGLIYRMVKPKIVLLIFVSGKVVLTGAKVGGPWRPGRRPRPAPLSRAPAADAGAAGYLSGL